MAALQDTARALVLESLVKGTRAQYARVLRAYAVFCGRHFPGHQVLPIGLQQILTYVAHCFGNNLSASTIRSHVSALSFVQNMVGGPEFAKNFLVQKAIVGVSKVRPARDQRAPLSKEILTQMLDNIHHIVGYGFTRLLFRAMFSLAFFALLRIGEISVESQYPRPSDKNVLRSSDVSLSNSPLSVTISFRDFKHKVPGSPNFLLRILGDGSDRCVVRLLAAYLEARGFSEGPLFLTADGYPVKRNHFRSVLQQSLQYCGLESCFKPHSFRIGGATEAMRLGYSSEQVQAMGRWRSQAFRRYIRLPKATVDFRE